MKVSKINNTSIADLIIATLFSARNTRTFKSILAERKFNRYKKTSVSVVLARLHRKGYILNSTSGWLITNKGKGVYLLDFLESPFNRNSPINTIISFDIPEKKRIVRNWLRNQIKIFGYKMLQQSLWIGPGPFPQSFLKRLENLNIRKNIKTFKVTAKN